jgi:hypothetical protein
LILPFGLAPNQIAFILINDKPELLEYYRVIYNALKEKYRCQLYSKSPQINLNIIESDREGTPLKIILGEEELINKKITLVNRCNIERKISVDISEDLQIRVERDKVNYLSLKEENITKIIEKERSILEENLYNNSSRFLKNNTFFTERLSELKKMIEEGKKGLFVIPFCNILDCEKTIKVKINSYSIRCLMEEKEKESECIFCEKKTKLFAYLGRSY